MHKRCAVCGDKHQINVRLVWRRGKDKKLFNVCMLCAERGKVTQVSVDNYKNTKNHQTCYN